LTAHLAARSVKAIVWARSTSVNEGPRCQRWSSSSIATGPGKGTCPKGTAKAL
jgi:hypothetical protein